MGGKDWRSQLDDLNRLLAEGKTDQEIADLLGRTEGSVIVQRLKMGLKRESQRWLRDQALKRLFEQGKTDREIGKALGYNSRTIEHRRLKLGLHRKMRGAWGPEDKEKLEGLYKQGKTDKEIGQALGRSRMAILQQRYKMGLVRWRCRRPGQKEKPAPPASRPRRRRPTKPIKKKKAKVELKECLRCGRKNVKSTGFHHRLCDSCREANANAVDIEVHA